MSDIVLEESEVVVLDLNEVRLATEAAITQRQKEEEAKADHLWQIAEAQSRPIYMNLAVEVAKQISEAASKGEYKITIAGSGQHSDPYFLAAERLGVDYREKGYRCGIRTTDEWESDNSGPVYKVILDISWDSTVPRHKRKGVRF